MTKKKKKEEEEEKGPFPFLGPSHNFPLTKSLTLNGLIPKPLLFHNMHLTSS